ncbi:unnamed protein product [Mytilus coruscus]|uniref:C-type lectin domain-containing protein n=1 Tax=Mytilus coruscus TaxID=42192 RepID=A0A6J8ANE4_MYTCO|nr:unnamed protein product [Mytilus coruscus]
MADGTMMTLMQMMMMSPTTTPSTTPATTTKMTVITPTPCVPRCPDGFMQLPDTSVSPKCFRAGGSPATFLQALVECSRTLNAYLWCPGSLAEDEAVRSKFQLGTNTVKTGCNDLDRKDSFMCVGSKRTCNPKRPPYGEGDSSTSTSKRCVDIEYDMKRKDKRKWSIVYCNDKKVFVCEVPIIPCP